MLLIMKFIAFDFVIFSNNLVKILFIKSFLVACLMCLNIRLISLKILESSLSGSIIMSLQRSSNLLQSCKLLFFVFLFSSQYFCHCVHFHQFLLRAYSHENTSQFYNLKHYIVFAYLLLPMNSLFWLALIVLLLKWHHFIV